MGCEGSRGQTKGEWLAWRLWAVKEETPVPQVYGQRCGMLPSQ